MKYTMVCLLILFLFALPVQSQDQPPNIECDLFPPDNIWNTRIDDLPVHSLSDTFIETISEDVALHPDFGSDYWPPDSDSPIGIAYTTVTGDQPLVDIIFTDYGDESDSGPYPIPIDAPIEGGADSDGDRHVLVVDDTNCVLYEMFYAFPQDDGSWEASSAAIYDLSSHDLRPVYWTSADAAGLPILPGLIRYEEIEAGRIEHAIRFTLSETRQAFIWPARHYASDLTDEMYPPMGQRFRLRADFDTSDFDPIVQIILTAMQEYGIILADNGAAMFISGAPDPRWDNDTLVEEFRRITAADFEAVDVCSLMIDFDSGQAAEEATTRNDCLIEED